MALFRVITLLIHAIVEAMASMLGAVFTHVLPAVTVGVIVIAALAAVFTSFGVGGAMALRGRKKDK